MGKETAKDDVSEAVPRELPGVCEDKGVPPRQVYTSLKTTLRNIESKRLIKGALSNDS